MPSLHDEYQTTQADAERTLAAMETITLKGTDAMTDADRTTMSTLEATSKRQFARLDELKALIDKRKQFAGHQLEQGGGSVTTPQKLPGQQEVENDRKNMSDKDKALEAVKRFAYDGSFDHRQFATVTTTTGNGIILPASILPPLTATQDNVVQRCLALFGVKPLETIGTDVIKIPVPDITAGGVITENATNGTDGTQSFSGSFNLTTAPVGSPQYWFSYAALNAPGYDMITAMLPSMQYAEALGEESTDLAAMKADTNIATGATTPAGAATLTYQNLLNWIEAVPANWQAAGQFGILSSSAYALALALTSDLANKLLTVDPGGLMRVKGCPVQKTSYLDSMAVSHCVGVTFSARGLMVRNGSQYRLNRYTTPSRRDQAGVEVVRDHVTAYTPVAGARLLTPAS